MSATVPQLTPASSPSASTNTQTKAASSGHGFGFDDLLDIVNPFQHLPVISTIYRRLSGDTMSAVSEIAGGALFGGLIGAALSAADVLFKEVTGKDFGSTALAWLGLDGKTASPVQTAAASATKPADTIPATATPTPAIGGPALDANLTTLIAAMRKQGIDPETAIRAVSAYRAATALKPVQQP